MSQIIIDIVGTLTVSGGLFTLIFKWWTKKQAEKREDEKERLTKLESQIIELTAKLEALTDEKLELSVKVARMEERLLRHAKTSKRRLDE